jgi:hypothetical protein
MPPNTPIASNYVLVVMPNIRDIPYRLEIANSLDPG